MSSQLSPKQQEIRDRQQAILKAALPMLAGEGYQGLSMDRIAAELRYAKGTIYNHFPNKEEIILQLAVDAMQLRRGLFERAAIMSGSSRDRIQAIGIAFELYVRVYSSHFKVEQLVRHESIWGKGSQARRDLMVDCEQNAMGLLAGIVRDGIAHGDLDRAESHDIAELLFGLWALTYGSYVIEQTSPSLSLLGISDVFRSVRVNSHRMLNGIPWHPCRSLDDDLQRYDEIAWKVFPEEASHLAMVTANHATQTIALSSIQ